MISADMKFYLANKAAREVFGQAIGGPEGLNGQPFRDSLEVWDETFTRPLEPREFPGMRLILAKAPYKDFRCAYAYPGSGNRITISVNGECLHDEETNEFLGGICWFKDSQRYSEFTMQQQNQMLQSHETICNIMPHLVWTSTPGGWCDWFSDR
jgi:hypothetical protein